MHSNILGLLYLLWSQRVGDTPIVDKRECNFIVEPRGRSWGIMHLALYFKVHGT